jgi:hypothetical protein
MSIATLQDIVNKIRSLTGSATNFQYTDAQIIDFINSFYLYDFPAQFRSLKLKDKFVFVTQRGIDVYPFDYEHYTTIQQPVFCAKRALQLFYDQWSFYGWWYNWQYQQTLAIGDGTNGARQGSITAATNAANCQITSASHGLVTGSRVTISGVSGMVELNGNTYTITVNSVNTFLLNVDSTAFGVYTFGGIWKTSPYNAFVTATPIIRSYNNNPPIQSPLFTTGSTPSHQPTTYPQTTIQRVMNILIAVNISYGNSIYVTDDGAGNLIGACLPGGSINYETGEVLNLAFTQIVPEGQAITIQYNPATLAIPQAIMFFQQQFTVRPVPDQAYTIEFVAYRQPSQAILGSDQNNLNMAGTPELLEWWECLAFGAAKKIYENRLDPDGVALMQRSLEERYQQAYTRTYAELGKNQMPSIFADQLSGFQGSGFGFSTGQGT